MKKSKHPGDAETAPKHNPVAKFAHRFNKACAFCDKSKYRRKAKHTGQEAYAIAPLRATA